MITQLLRGLILWAYPYGKGAGDVLGPYNTGRCKRLYGLKMADAASTKYAGVRLKYAKAGYAQFILKGE